MQSPIFIFSLPRSGSTLMQRVLMSHEDICSVAEPWVLLPQIYMLKSEGTLSEYSSRSSHEAISDFIKNLPNGNQDYNSALRNFILELYTKQCRLNERYFLDKTPRYYLIIDEIVKLFPDAKFIFLFRNPIHVYASMISTWGENRFRKVRSSQNDIALGTKLLSKAYKKYNDIAISVNYESFVSNFEIELKRITDYLDLELSQDVLNNFQKQDTKGSLGDPTGVKEYSNISKDGIDKWKKVFNSRIRKKFALKLLKNINPEDLEVQGYNNGQITKEIKALNSKNPNYAFRDFLDYYFNSLIIKFNLNLYFNKKFAWVKRKFLS